MHFFFDLIFLMLISSFQTPDSNLAAKLEELESVSPLLSPLVKEVRKNSYDYINSFENKTKLESIAYPWTLFFIRDVYDFYNTTEVSQQRQDDVFINISKATKALNNFLVVLPFFAKFGFPVQKKRHIFLQFVNVQFNIFKVKLIKNFSIMSAGLFVDVFLKKSELLETFYDDKPELFNVNSVLGQLRFGSYLIFSSLLSYRIMSYTFLSGIKAHSSKVEAQKIIFRTFLVKAFSKEQTLSSEEKKILIDILNLVKVPYEDLKGE